MDTYIRIDSNKAKDLLLQNPNTTLIDIRQSGDYNQSHDEKSVHITETNIESFILNTPKNNPLIIMCYHGISSQRVAQYLVEEGFDEVYSLDGGYEEWKGTKK